MPLLKISNVLADGSGVAAGVPLWREVAGERILKIFSMVSFPLLNGHAKISSLSLLRLMPVHEQRWPDLGSRMNSGRIGIRGG